MGLLNLIGHKYPFTDFHELNLDWCIESIIKLQTVVDTFVDSESIKFADPIQWNITTQYLKATIVLNQNGDAYLSRQFLQVLALIILITGLRYSTSWIM